MTDVFKKAETLWDKIPDKMKILFAEEYFKAMDKTLPVEVRQIHAETFINRYRCLFQDGLEP